MKIEEYIIKLITELDRVTGLSFYVAGQAQETSKTVSWGTIQLVGVTYKNNDKSSAERGKYSKKWIANLQINVNTKYDPTTQNAFNSIKKINDILIFLGKEYYYTDSLEPKRHVIADFSDVKDLSVYDNQKPVYTNSITITVHGVEDYEFERVPIEKVSGTLEEIITKEFREVGPVENDN